MTTELMLAFAGFAFVTSITPGPNNMMLLASGANFGFRRTLPHLLGVVCGCLFMVLMVGVGLGGLFVAFPSLYFALRIAGAAYLLVLAWKIAHAGPLRVGSGRGRPMGFWAALAFQWVNPKAWVMVVGAVTTYTPREGFFFNLVVVAVTFAAINAPSIAVWVGFGTALRRLLDRPARLLAFNWTMAGLLVLSLYPLLLGEG